MSKTIITTTKAPAPIGPYNQAVFAGDMCLFPGRSALIRQMVN